MNRKQRRAQQAAAIPGPASGPDHLFQLAVLLFRAGRLSEAGRTLDGLLADAPGHAPALHLRGIVARNAGDLSAARTALERAVARDAAVPAFHRDLGSVVALLGRLPEAERVLSRAVSLDPRDAEARAEHAAVLRRMNHPEQAAAAYAAAVALRPDAAAHRSNHGIVLRELGRLSEALSAQEAAARLDPGSAAIRFNLGNVLRDLGRPSEAIAAWRRCLAGQPGFAPARCNLGFALLETGQLDEAAAAFAAVLDRASPDIDTPDGVLVDAERGLGEVHAARSRPFEALARFDAALRLRPTDAVTHSNRGTALLDLGRFTDADDAWAEAIRLRPDLADAWSNRQMGAHYRADLPATVRVSRARAFADRFESVSVAPFPPDPDPDRPLRLGYVSADLCRHPVGLLLLPVLAHHDPARVHVTCYDARPRDDDVSRALRNHAARWRDISRLSDAAAAAAIREDDIDVLVDLSGHTAGNRLPVFARRAAPVQCSWLGYWDTTGLSRMDAVLSDADTVHPGEEGAFTEEVVRLPHGRFTFAPPADAPPVSPPPAARTGTVTFGCFNNLSKLSAEVVSCWTGILDAVPASRLVLKWKTLADPAVRASITARFRAAGLDLDRDPTRLELRPASPHAVLLAEYADIDLALDPFPFSGAQSSLDALWMGVPVLTVPGTGFASRQTAGFLRVLDLPELVAPDPAEYGRRAVALAANPNRLATLRATLRPRMAASRLCDAPGFTASLEDALHALWRSRQAAFHAAGPS